MQAGIPHKTAGIQVEQAISSIWAAGYPTAVWRLPNSDIFHFLFSKNKTPDFRKTDFEELPSGFVMAPFENSDTETLFISSDFYCNFKHQEELIDEQIQTFLEEQPEEINKAFPQKSKSDVYSESGEKAFIEDVNKAIAAIEQGEFEKVVLSRIKIKEASSDFQPLNHLNLLADKYKSAFVSLVYLPWSDEIWLGATPEKLVEQDAEGIFRTMALAGTQSSKDGNGNPILEKNALWTQKEIIEQALVGRYIINCFKKIRVREYKELGPNTISAGNILHLQSTFEVNTKEINFPQLGSVMLDLLHPTSAVCGMPKEKALDFIKETESYNREYYSGFLGPVNVNQSSNIFVNLRTMKVVNKQISLYAGCGITADSDAEKEWLETEIKLLTVLP